MLIGTELEKSRLEDIEFGLRLVIGKRHNDACMARLESKQASLIERFDSLYEQALETYRVVVGKEPTAA